MRLAAVITSAGLAACTFDASGLSGGEADTDARPVADPDARPIGDAGPGPGDPDASVAAPDARPPDAGDDDDDDDDDGDEDLTAPHTSSPPNVDGDLGEWAAAPRVRFDIADAEHTFEGHPNYEASASVDVRARHDADNLYVAFDVTDDVLVVDGGPLFNDDAMNLYLDGAGDRSGPYGEDDHAFVIRTDGDFADESSGGDASGVETASRSNDDGYTLEVKIPKILLGDDVGDAIGFNIAITDDDGHGTPNDDAYGLWKLPEGDRCSDCCAGLDDAQAWCDTTMFGQLALEPSGE